jgi:hypothetical protein
LLLRYEVDLSREIDRTLNQLERAQRQRKGQPLPPKLDNIGMDVHRESISIAVINSVGKVELECVVEAKASIILRFITGLRGDLHVTFEEGTWAAWLHDLLKPHVTRLVVCDPRNNASMKLGNKSDKIDARRLAKLLPHRVVSGKPLALLLRDRKFVMTVNLDGGALLTR